MRRFTELSANIRGMMRLPQGWNHRVWDEDSKKMGPSALGALAHAEAVFIGVLVELSGCVAPEQTPPLGDVSHEHEVQAGSPVVP